MYTYLKVTKMTELASGLQGLNKEAFEELLQYCEEAQAMAEKTIPVAQNMRHSEYNKIMSMEKRLSTNFALSQAFQNLLHNLVDDHVIEITQNVLNDDRDDKFEGDINAKLLDEKCIYLQQIFDEEVHANLKPPFLIEYMKAKDETQYESLQARTKEIIKEMEIWKNSNIAETDQKVVGIKETYSGTKDQLDDQTQLDMEKNQGILFTSKDVKTQNSEMKRELTKGNHYLKVTQERKEIYKQRADEIFLELKDLISKYCVICPEAKEDLLK